MKNVCILRKYAVLLALSACNIVSASAQGAVTGYAFGKGWFDDNPSAAITTFPTNAQLQRLTHVIASDIGCYSVSSAYTGLWIDKLPNNWSGGKPSDKVWKKANHSNNKNLWLESLVNRAHTEGVKAILCVGGGVTEHEHWVNATSGLITNSSSNISKFVSDIVSFVNLHGFDGVDIDWECPGLDLDWEPIAEPQRTTAWTQYINLLNALKTALPCKRISIALPAAVPDPYDAWLYPNLTIPQQIWAAVDAFHLMTYDVRSWTSHSYAASSKWVIDEWANWNNTQNLGLNNKKLHLGCAFYGYKKNGSTTLWGDANKVNYATYSGGGTYNPGDTPGGGGSLEQKVNHCYTNVYGGYGGVFAWELGYDANTSTTPTLLNSIWTTNATSPNNGYPAVSITTHPAASTTVTQGCISGSLSVVTNKTCKDAIYQWYKNATNSNSGGTSLGSTGGAQTNTLTIPANLTAGPHYFYCVVKSGRSTATSNVAQVTAITAPNFTFNVNNGPSSVNPNQVYCSFYLENITGVVSAYSNYYQFAWYVNTEEGWLNLDNQWGYPPSSSTACLYFPGYINYVSCHTNGVLDIKCVATNPYTCQSYTSYTCISCPSCQFVNKSASASFAYPNPVDDVLFVDIDAAAGQFAPGVQRQAPTYDVRFYDGQGNLLRQQKARGGTVEFNVSNLPDGMYYLHIYDDAGTKPIMETIMVQH